MRKGQPPGRRLTLGERAANELANASRAAIKAGHQLRLGSPESSLQRIRNTRYYLDRAEAAIRSMRPPAPAESGE
jgi:hypothetical protein